VIHRSEDLNFFAYLAWKNWSAYSGPQNGGFGGLWTPKCDFSSSRPPEGTPLRKSASFKLSNPLRGLTCRRADRECDGHTHPDTHTHTQYILSLHSIGQTKNVTAAAVLGWWLRSIVIDAAVHGPPSTHTSSSSNRGTLLAHISLALSVPTWITALLCWSAFILEDWPRYGPSLSPAASISRIVSITACSVLDQFSPLCWQLMVSQFNPPFFVCQMMFLASYSLQIVMFFTVWPNCVHFFLYILKKIHSRHQLFLIFNPFLCLLFTNISTILIIVLL